MAWSKAQHAAHSRKRRRALTDAVNSIKACPCVDCGVQYPPYVMQFDHVRGFKVASIGRLMAHWGDKDILVRLAEEMSKCEVVCANCHAARTWERM